jgi:RNA polymerase sigma-70 factor, ECF subfamily
MTSINVEKVRARDEQALGELFNELMPELRRVARRFHADLDPDEVVADVVVQLLRNTDHLADLAASGKLRSYCAHLTRNVALHQAQKARRAQRAAVDFDELVGLAAGEEYSHGELEELQKQFRTAITSLGSSERALIEMLYVQEKSLDEIAQDLAISRPAVRIKLHRALQHLRRLMLPA